MSRLRDVLSDVGIYAFAGIAIVVVYTVVFGRSVRSLFLGRGFAFKKHLANSFGGRQDGPVIYERR